METTVRIIHSLNVGKNEEFIYLTEDLKSPASDFVKFGDKLLSDEQVEWSHVPQGFPMEWGFKKDTF